MAVQSQKSILSGLTASQREIVIAPAGPILVFAGAGSGKTRTLTHRLAYLVASGVRPARIVALTFTNKAAGEMKNRISVLLDKQPRALSPFIGTFHGFCARVLRIHGVGDNWQSIYAFRGSDYRNILRFEKDWPGAKIFFLEENFRSTGIIVEAANCVIAKNQYRADCGDDDNNDGIVEVA